MRVAMISYNTFVDGESNGWKNNGENSVLLLQNTEGKMWGTSQPGKTEQEWKEETADIVDPLWENLKSELPTIDKVVFYVGSYGAERVIELAGDNGLTPDRAIFVMCDCNMGNKMRAVQSRGFSSSKIVECSCGGHSTMYHIFFSALRGVLPN